VEALERGDILPYPLIRAFAETFDLASRAEELVEASEQRRQEVGDEDEASRRRRRKARLEPLMLNAILSWEFCRVNPGFCFAFGASLGLAGHAILSKGTLEQKRRWALPIFSFEKIGCWALTEPGAGSDALGSMITRAVRVDGGWRITGQKRFITNAPYADYFVVYARMQTLEGRETVGAFVLERGDVGLATSRPLRKMGLHTSPTGDVFLDEVFVPSDRLLGGEIQSRRGEVVKRLAAERAGMVPMCLGIMERCLELSVQYVKERTQFGRPLADFQLVQAKLARMYVAFENGKGLFERTVEQQADDSLDLKLACVAKLYIAEETTRVALDAVQLLGGNGYMQEYLVEMFARDAKLFEIGGGTNEIQLLTIARELLNG
jgi:alkylation response protein AidB-like acyl-CoA dehydrogenase